MPTMLRPKKQVVPCRFTITHLFAILIFISVSLFLFTGDSPAPAARSSSSGSSKDTASSSLPFSFACPRPSSRHPYVILQGDGVAEAKKDRTFSLAATPFLPYSMGETEQEYRFATTRSSSEDASECVVHKVPSSMIDGPVKGWKDGSLMFGMATSHDRVIFHLPVWSHWLRSSTSSSKGKQVPSLLVLIEERTTPAEEKRKVEAERQISERGLDIKLVPTKGETFALRYFNLVEAMWKDALELEEKGEEKKQWFAFLDDDTFFPSYYSLVSLISEHDPTTDILLGSLSESKMLLSVRGHSAFGGAGVFLSRSLLAKLNTPGTFAECLARFSSSPGDALLTLCASHVLSLLPTTLLTLAPSLRQLDIRGDSSGVFQAGLQTTSLHHWDSWYTLFPPWIAFGRGDTRAGVSLVGETAEMLGGKNWGRRIVFEEGRVVVSLGYSVVVHWKKLGEEELGRLESTWFEFDVTSPVRPGLEEGVEKRSYYLTKVSKMADGVVEMEHRNKEGETIVILWDGRGDPKGKGWTRWGKDD